jgi:hypothetical protein
MDKKFTRLFDDWKLASLAFVFVMIIVLCYGWGVAKIVASFETAFGVQGAVNSIDDFHIEEAKKVLEGRQ